MAKGRAKPAKKKKPGKPALRAKAPRPKAKAKAKAKVKVKVKAKASKKPKASKAKPKIVAKAKPKVAAKIGTRPLRRERTSRPPLRSTSPASAARRGPRAPAASLDWNDGVSALPPFTISESLLQRWVQRGEDLLAKLKQHGAASHEYRADLREGRFVWIAPDGRVSVEARAQVVCSWSRTTSVVAMAWTDPLVRPAAIARLDGMPAERDDADEETAWRIAMAAADACGAEYLYRVPTPHAWYFIALYDLTFNPEPLVFVPGTPVGLVLRSLAETRLAIASRAEPADVVRERLTSVGDSLRQQAEYAYRDTDWVARLERTGKRVMHLAERVARPSYGSIAAGRPAEEWVDRDIAVDLIEALVLLEDEWSAFA